MGFKERLNKIVKLKTISIVLFIIAFLCGIGIFITNEYLSNMITPGCEIKEDFTFKVVDSYVENGEVFYVHNIKGAFCITDSDWGEGKKLRIEFVIDEKTNYTSTTRGDYIIPHDIEKNVVYNVDFNTTNFFKFKEIWSIRIIDEEDLKLTFKDAQHDIMYKDLFLPLIIIASTCLFFSIICSIIFKVKRKSEVKYVANIQNDLSNKEKQTNKELRCPYCNTRVEKNDKHCSGCGSKL